MRLTAFVSIYYNNSCLYTTGFKDKEDFDVQGGKQTIIEVTELPFPYKPPKDITTLIIAQIKSMTSRHLVSTIITFVHIMTPLNTKKLSTYIFLISDISLQKYQLLVFIFLKYKTLSQQSIIFLFSKPIDKKHLLFIVFKYCIYLYLKYHKS